MILKSYCLRQRVYRSESTRPLMRFTQLSFYILKTISSVSLWSGVLLLLDSILCILQGAVVDSEVALQSSSIFSVCFSKYG